MSTHWAKFSIWHIDLRCRESKHVSIRTGVVLLVSSGIDDDRDICAGDYSSVSAIAPDATVRGARAVAVQLHPALTLPRTRPASPGNGRPAAPGPHCKDPEALGPPRFRPCVQVFRPCCSSLGR